MSDLPEKAVETHFPLSIAICRDCGHTSTPGVRGGKCQVRPGVYKDHDWTVVEAAPAGSIRKQERGAGEGAARRPLPNAHQRWRGPRGRGGRSGV